MSSEAVSILVTHERRDKLGGTLVASAAMHAVLFVVLIAYTGLGSSFGGGWGKNWGAGNSTRIGAVASLPGVPLPAPMLSTHNTLASENPGLHRTEPASLPLPEPKAIPIPKFKTAVKPEKAERVNTHIQKEKPVEADNAVPYGLGGQPSMNYTQMASAAGQGGLSFGEGGDFGERYGYYVASVRSRISGNWLLSTVSPNIVSAPRLYMTFTILRDGNVTDVEITQSSGIPEVDRSALRAVLASNPLPPLPPDYSGNKVKVNLYFDFHR
ncbi:Cell division and transport-associated protein TolA [Acidobacteriia bacterium SbA2]|nr:Cell division and transport-associated protein TolA [Acidobacteriia bacterium SbA2]